MSVEIVIQKISISPINIQEVLGSWTKKEEIVGIISGNQADRIHYFIPGISIRGFSLNQQHRFIKHRFELRLSVCASEGDWGAAYSFLRFAQQQGFKVKSEAGDILGANELSRDSASARAIQQFAADVNALKAIASSSGGRPIELPTDSFVVPVKREDLPADNFDQEALIRLRQVLLQRAAKYAKARPAAVITLKTGKTLIVWAGEPLLSQEVDYIACYRRLYLIQRHLFTFRLRRQLMFYQIELKRSGIIHHYFVLIF